LFIILYIAEKTTAMEKVRDMKKHVTFVAALHIGFGVLGFIVSITLYFVLEFAESFVHDVDVADVVMNMLKIFLPSLIGLRSVLGIIGGISLMKYRQWARILIIVLSALDCIKVPIGTAKGVYSIWTLMQDDTIKLFKDDHINKINQV